MIFLAPLAAFLAGSVAGLVKRAVVALGFGVVVIAGFGMVKADLVALIQSQLGAIPADVFAILALGGVVDAIGIWLGAMTTVLSVATLKRLALQRS
jgi:hypothetical protein